MLQQQYISNNKAFCLYVSIKSSTPEKREFRIVASDLGKNNSKYADRVITVEGSRDIYLSFPISPKSLLISIMDKNKPVESNDFTVTLKEGRIRSTDAWLDADTHSFVQLGIVVSQILGFTEAPKVYKSSDNLYTISMLDVITDNTTGSALTTPARIGHTSGVIEISKQKMNAYTIPMRMIILLHEFSHKYKNPTMGLEISNEVGADINALYIYLSMGFSKIDAIHVFSTVFYNTQSETNIKRMRIIMDYINKFDEKRIN